MNFQILRDIVAARGKSLAFLAFLLLLATAVQLYLSLWQRPALEKAQVEWFARRDAIARGEAVGDASRYHNGMRDLAEFQKRLVPKERFPALMSQIYDSAKKNSLSLKGVSYKPGKLKDQKQIATYGVSFTVSGHYGSVKSFIADLLRYNELITVDSIALGSQSQTEEMVNLRVQTTVYMKTEGA
ncbi:Predicted secretion system W protein PilO-like [Citrifermentans bremense]|uniref:Predicted secretion system W protein PilO-like n=1 Tax=Citrifermentans bremense TaxID=60035 RepID=A0A6S6M8M6_9BACT|nr:type 4a pilus biogenesis protein PilO [Citrifermentans bremense]BCG48094.1 Predicted secretion system W protein PilO-like [Citrifermentans bremense]